MERVGLLTKQGLRRSHLPVVKAEHDFDLITYEAQAVIVPEYFRPEPLDRDLRGIGVGHISPGVGAGVGPGVGAGFHSMVVCSMHA